MEPEHPLKGITKLPGLRTRLDETVHRLTGDFAALGSPPTGSSEGAGGLEGASGRVLLGQRGSSKVGPVAFLLVRFTCFLGRTNLSSLCGAPWTVSSASEIPGIGGRGRGLGS